MSWSKSLPVPGPIDDVDVPGFLLELTAPQLRALADLADRIARVARQRAATVEHRAAIEISAKASLAKLRQLGDVVAGLVASGVPTLAALEEAAAGAGVPVETAAVYWRDKRRRQSLSRKLARRFQVAGLISSGKSHREIAEQLGVSVRTVERTLAELRAVSSLSGRMIARRVGLTGR